MAEQNSRELERRLEALQRLIGWARGDHYCPDCEGTGRRSAPPVDITDPDYEWDCETCDGSGEVET